ncbi:hypothetical protein GCM10009850_101490 [Nonomuraea monospora]|uniref:Uncharacterized protein n=1 Tax=Nonomuraea monospora TaxID=568818 RepID=A0ABN3CYS3_9ACTN
MTSVTTSSAAAGAVAAPTNLSRAPTAPAISSTPDTSSPTIGANAQWRQSYLDTLQPHLTHRNVKATPKHT